MSALHVRAFQFHSRNGHIIMSGLKSEVKRFAKTHCEEDVSAFKACYNVGRPGILPNESTEQYHSWSSEYEQVHYICSLFFLTKLDLNKLARV